MCLRCEAVAEYEDLPTWNGKTARPADVGTHFWLPVAMRHKKVTGGYRVVCRTLKSAKHGVGYRRACETCGKATRGSDEALCGAHGGKGSNGALNARNKAKRDAGDVALQELLDANPGLAVAPENVEEATSGVVYARRNPQNGQLPGLCIVQRRNGTQGDNYVFLCEHGTREKPLRPGNCKDCTPATTQTDSSWKCSGCARSLHRNRHVVGLCPECDTKNEYLRKEGQHAAIRKEHMVNECLMHAFAKLGRLDVIDIKRDMVLADCTGGEGSSGRREDVGFAVSSRYHIAEETCENQHKGKYYEGCTDADKTSAHMIDCGAPHITAAEDELWSKQLPLQEELEAMEDTEADTPAMQRLRRARRQMKQRLERDARDAARTKAVAKKYCVVRFNPDAFVDCHGVEHPGLFEEVPDAERDGSMRFRPTARLQPAVDALAARLVRLIDAEADDAWFDAQPSLYEVHLRYDGCRPNGEPATKKRANPWA